MLSVLIPTHNYNIVLLVNKLHQLLVLENIPFEICVFEDASTRFLKKNETITNLPYVHYKRLNHNIGRTAIRQALAKHASYSWLLFLDADVMPPNKLFIKSYLEAITTHKQTPIFFGGICYTPKMPKQDNFLRWKYGHKREAKSVKKRLNTPHVVMSLNLLIKKQNFLALNLVKTDLYGLDNVFSYHIKKTNTTVVHLDNPVLHLGLEKNARFLKKALKAVKTTVLMEEQGLLAPAERPLQKLYVSLKKWKIVGVFQFVISKLQKPIEHNLTKQK